MNIKISICTGLMLNDHSNPYIESTTVLSDVYINQVIKRLCKHCAPIKIHLLVQVIQTESA